MRCHSGASLFEILRSPKYLKLSLKCNLEVLFRSGVCGCAVEIYYNASMDSCVIASCCFAGENSVSSYKIGLKLNIFMEIIVLVLFCADGARHSKIFANDYSPFTVSGFVAHNISLLHMCTLWPVSERSAVQHGLCWCNFLWPLNKISFAELRIDLFHVTNNAN